MPSIVTCSTTGEDGQKGTRAGELGTSAVMAQLIMIMRMTIVTEQEQK